MALQAVNYTSPNGVIFTTGFWDTVAQVYYPAPSTALPTQSIPTAFSATITGGQNAIQILAAGVRVRVSFYVQGTGYGVYSFTSSTPTVSTDGVTTNGYLIVGGGSFSSSPVACPSSALYMACSAGSTMTVYGEYQ
jgi:hypothetical protein